MQEIIKILIGMGLLALGIPIGNYLAKATKEELKSGQKWFKLIIIASLVGGIIGLIIGNDILLFSLFFIAIVTSRCLRSNTMDKLDYIKAEKYVFRKLDKELPKNLYYHGIHHTKEVLKTVKKLASFENISQDKFLLLKTGALYHDTGFLEQYQKNEPIGTKIAKESLLKFGYNPKQINIISGIIMATQIPQKPITDLEKIMCDADVFNFGREDFFEKGDLLRRELATKGVVFTDLEWYKNSLKLLEGHNFWTASARNITKVQKAKNIEILKRKNF